MFVECVGVVGAGLMGAGIAEVCARSGAQVLVVETSAEAVEAWRRRLERSVGRALRAGRLTRTSGTPRSPWSATPATSSTS